MIATEIVENLEAGLDSFRSVMAGFSLTLIERNHHVSKKQKAVSIEAAFCFSIASIRSSRRSGAKLSGLQDPAPESHTYLVKAKTGQGR